MGKVCNKMRLRIRFSVILLGLKHLNTCLLWKSSQSISRLNLFMSHVQFQEITQQVYAVYLFGNGIELTHITERRYHGDNSLHCNMIRLMTF